MTRNWRLMHNAYGICVIKRIQINLPKCEVDSYMWQFKSYFSVYSSLHTVFVYIKWRCSVFIRVTREKWKAMQCTEKNIKITWDEDEKEEKEEEKPNTSNVIRAQQQHSERSRIWKKKPKRYTNIDLRMMVCAERAYLHMRAFNLQQAKSVWSKTNGYIRLCI